MAWQAGAWQGVARRGRARPGVAGRGVGEVRGEKSTGFHNCHEEPTIKTMNTDNANQAMIEKPDFLSKDQIALLKRTMLKNFSSDDQEVFIQIALRVKLDPWSRQLYPTKRTLKQRNAKGEIDYVVAMVPVTGIQGLTAIADRTGNYNGVKVYWSGPDGKWREEWLEEDFPEAAKAIVYHKQREYPEVGIARWRSFAGQQWNKQTSTWEYTDFWLKMPDFMLSKCARAMALRGAFPDQLSSIYIAEELEGHDADTAAQEVTGDEAKIASNQQREARILEQPFAGARVVETHGAQPSPAAALEPTFPEDREPAPPAPARTQAAPVPDAALVVPKPAAPPVATPTHTEKQQMPDDLDMTPVPPAAEPIATPWADHVIKGVKSDRYKGRKIGELNEMEMNVIATQWLPKVRAQWNDATEEQKADAAMFEAAIAYQKMARPW